MLAARRTGAPHCPSQTAHPVLGMHRFALAVALAFALEALFVVGAAAVATFYNAGLHSGADPYTLYDEQTGLYHAYSTSGQDPGWLFAIYTSPDLSTWTRRPGGAMRACTHNGTALQTGQVCWAKDWQWAPEVYHNARTGWYFLFFGARLREDLRKDYFQYSAYEEATKIGVAVSKRAGGPFREIEPNPIDYHPFDPWYRDVNLIMDAAQMRPPASPRHASLAPRGSYISAIDPNLYIGPDAKHIFLFYSRTAYRNWVWDPQLEKFVEESNILAVQLSTDWWNDAEAKTMPRIIDAEVDRRASEAAPLLPNITAYNGTGQIGYPPRKDGWTAVITYQADPQSWENAGVNDYAKSNGTSKDRRWAEGSSLVSRRKPDGELVYLLTYSANYFATAQYGVGFATAQHPLGPYTKSHHNPILSQIAGASTSIVSTGHGSIVATRPLEKGGSSRPRLTVQSPVPPSYHWNPVEQDTQRVMYETPPGSELFYVHHARNSSQADRALYSTRLTLHIDGGKQSRMAMNLTAADQPLARGTAPIYMQLRGSSSGLSCVGNNIIVEIAVLAAGGGAFDLSEASNRVVLRSQHSDDVVAPLFSTLLDDGSTSLLLFRTQTLPAHLYYQRRSSRGQWHDVVGLPAACP